MSPHIIVDLNELQATLVRLNRAYRNKRNNERPLVSRNKREGWYLCKGHRTTDKELALRYRKQSGVQWLRIKR